MAMLNVVSLPKHLDEIRLLLHDKKIDILALNEIRLDSTISDELVSIQGVPKKSIPFEMKPLLEVNALLLYAEPMGALLQHSNKAFKFKQRLDFKRYTFLRTRGFSIVIRHSLPTKASFQKVHFLGGHPVDGYDIYCVLIEQEMEGEFTFT